MFGNYLEKLGQLLNSVECRVKGQRLDCASGVDTVVELLFRCRQQGKKVMWVGNGGSAAIAAHSAIDYWRTGSIKAMSFNEGPLLTCIGNDFGYASVFEKPLQLFADKGDILVAISSSGQSENIIKAVEAAKVAGCAVVTASGFKEDNPLRLLGDVNFYVPSRHYGHVELVHGVLCHSFLDLFMVKQGGTINW